MLLFVDIISGDEMVTDAYQMELKDDAFYYIKGEFRQYKSDDVDDSAIGGNKSAEGEDYDTGVDTDTTTQIDVVHDNRLVEVFFADKKDFIKRNLKGFLACVKKSKADKGELNLDDKCSCDQWEAGMNGLIKKHILSEFKNLQFFAGESGSEEGHVACVNFIDDKPVVILFKDGLKEVKM